MRTESKSLRITIPPAREPTGGANEDVSWLRANRLAFPGYPSGIEPITAARYSGGAAPDLHRLPYPHSQMNCSLSLGEQTSVRKVRGTWCVVRRHETRTTYYAPRTGFLFNAHTKAPTIPDASSAMM